MSTRPLRSVTAALLLLSMLAIPAVVADTGPAAGAPPAAVLPGGGGSATADFDTIASLDELTGDHARLFRLYWAFFGREPDAEGALYWV